MLPVCHVRIIGIMIGSFLVSICASRPLKDKGLLKLCGLPSDFPPDKALYFKGHLHCCVCPTGQKVAEDCQFDDPASTVCVDRVVTPEIYVTSSPAPSTTLYTEKMINTSSLSCEIPNNESLKCPTCPSHSTSVKDFFLALGYILWLMTFAWYNRERLEKQLQILDRRRQLIPEEEQNQGDDEQDQE